jgi:MFS-type transporter involved in bile tolerance (Atg22 family)
MKLPEANRTAYLGFYSIFSQVCAITGQWIGTTFVQFTPNLNFTLFGVEICNLQLTSGIAAAAMIGLVLYTLRMSRNPEYSVRP